MFMHRDVSRDVARHTPSSNTLSGSAIEPELEGAEQGSGDGFEGRGTGKGHG